MMQVKASWIAHQVCDITCHCKNLFALQIIRFLTLFLRLRVEKDISQTKKVIKWNTEVRHFTLYYSQLITRGIARCTRLYKFHHILNISWTCSICSPITRCTCKKNWMLLVEYKKWETRLKIKIFRWVQ